MTVKVLVLVISLNHSWNVVLSTESADCRLCSDTDTNVTVSLIIICATRISFSLLRLQLSYNLTFILMQVYRAFLSVNDMVIEGRGSQSAMVYIPIVRRSQGFRKPTLSSGYCTPKRILVVVAALIISFSAVFQVLLVFRFCYQTIRLVKTCM